MQPFNTKQEITAGCHEVLLISPPRNFARSGVVKNLLFRHTTESACIAGYSSQEGTGRLTAMCLLGNKATTGSLPNWEILPDHAWSVYLLLLIL